MNEDDGWLVRINVRLAGPSIGGQACRDRIEELIALPMVGTRVCLRSSCGRNDQSTYR